MSDSMKILLADDDPDDRDMIRDAFAEGRIANEVRVVCDGEELLDYLLHRGKFENPSSSPRPGIILLDLNMPRKDGREALKEIKSHPELKTIPIVVLTTSKAQEDVLRSYNLGVNSFVTKPVKFNSLVELARGLGRYWFEIVELPDNQTKRPFPNDREDD
jgi:CheY-like chemotaxis protein